MIAQLAVAHIGSAGYELLPRIVNAFRHGYPLVDLHIHQMNTAEQIVEMITGNIDIGFLRVAPEHDGIEAVRLFSEPFVCAMPDRYVWADRKAVSLSDLASSPFVTLFHSPAPSLYQQVLDLCSKAGFQPRIVQEVETIEAAVGLIGFGIGVTLAPASLRNLSIPSVCYVPLDDVRDEAEIWLAWPRGSVAPAARAFLQCACSAVK